MRVWSDSEKQLKAEIREKLDKMSCEEWVYNDFNKVVMHDRITKKLDQALQETRRQFINKHGVEHGLKVARNVLCLFELIHNGAVESDYLSRKLLSSKATVLACLLFASYVHDIGRFFDRDINHEEQIDIALEILTAQSHFLTGSILQRIASEEIQEILDRTKELCLCHDKKESTSGSVEIALIKLADCLDCDCSRAYEIEPSLKRSAKMGIFLRDKYPEKYFGCLSVYKTNTEYNDREEKIEITLTVNSFVAAIPIKTILNVLKKCEESGGSASQLAKKIRLYVAHEEDKGHTYRLYPEEVPPGVTEENVRKSLKGEISGKLRQLIEGGWIRQAVTKAEYIYSKDSSKGLQLVSILLSSKEENDWDRAWEVIKEIEEVPSAVYVSLAYLFWSLGRTKNAIEVAERGLEVAKKRKDQVGINRLKNSLAYYYADLGEPDYEKMARSHAEEAFSARPEDPAPMDTKGYVKITYGKHREEIEEGICLCEEARRKGAPLKLYLKHIARAAKRLRVLE